MLSLLNRLECFQKLYNLMETKNDIKSSFIINSDVGRNILNN